MEEKIKAMRLYSKHKKGCLAFLKAWKLMVLELDKVKETPVSDDDKRQWLVKSLMTHDVLYKVCNDASNLEHTLVSLSKSSGDPNMSELKKVSFSAFFNMLDQAARREDRKNKIVRETQCDHRQAHQATQRQNHNCTNNQNTNNNNNNNSSFNPRDWFLPRETCVGISFRFQIYMRARDLHEKRMKNSKILFFSPISIESRHRQRENHTFFLFY